MINLLVIYVDNLFTMFIFQLFFMVVEKILEM